MKRIKKHWERAILVLMAICIALLIFGAGEPQGNGTEESPFYAPSRQELTLEWNNNNIGNLTYGIHAEIYNADNALVHSFSVTGDGIFNPALEQHRIILYEHIRDLPNGVYWLQIRVEDPQGNLSDWSDRCWFEKMFATVNRPTGCKIF